MRFPLSRLTLIALTRVLPAALWLVLGSGCGNKGDLVLPDAPPPVATEDADSDDA